MKKNKIALIVLSIAALVIVGAILFIPWNIQQSVTVEAGIDEIPLDQFSKDGKPLVLVTDASGIDLNQPGEYTLELARDNRTFRSILRVVDTTPPTGVPVNHEIYNDESLAATDFVTDIRDVTETTVAFATAPDFTVAGEQTVTLHLTDTSGNVGMVTAKLTVLADTTAPVFSPMEDLKVNLGQTVSYR